MAFESFTFQSNIVEKFYVGENLKKQGKCSFTLTRDGFLFFYASYTLPKNSPYTDWFSRGFVVVGFVFDWTFDWTLLSDRIIRLHETGLPKLWESWFVQNPARCLNYAGQKPSKPRLNMKHLSSAFILLFAGYVLSGIVFLFERMRSGYKISNNRL